MTSQWQGPTGPAGPGGPAGEHPAAPRQRSNTIWWVLIGVAAVALVGLLVWALLPGEGSSEDPTPPPSTQPVTTEPTDPGSTEPTDPEPGGVWGDFPPANLESLRDLGAPEFPETLDGFTLLDSEVTALGGSGHYENLEEVVAFSGHVYFGHPQYVPAIAELDDPTYVGAAVCGTMTTETGRTLKRCVMAGSNEVLMGQTVSDGASLDDVAALTELLYEQL